jgi:hypothetical protein
MADKSRRRLSDEERDERRRADRERLQDSAQQLLSSEGWQRWIRVRSQAGLARLSLSNQLLVGRATQPPPTTDLASNSSDDPQLSGAALTSCPQGSPVRRR